MKRSLYQTLVRPTLLLLPLAFAFSACLPNGLADGLMNFGFFEMQSSQSCDSLEQSLKTRAMIEARQRAASGNPSTDYNPTGFMSAGRDSVDVRHKDTNVQEEGVDEADIFKVSEGRVFTLHGDAFIIAEATEEAGRVVGAKQLSFTHIEGEPFDMFVEGNRAVVMARTTHSEVKRHFQADAPERSDSSLVTKTMLFDISDPTTPKLLRETLVEGDYISSRRVDGRVYIVSKALLDGPRTADNPSTSTDKATWLARRKTAINNASIEDWMPHYYDIRYASNGSVETEAKHCSCNTTFSSKASAGDDAIAVYSIGLESGESNVETAVIIGDGAVVYSSQRSLVVALTNYNDTKFAGVKDPSAERGGSGVDDWDNDNWEDDWENDWEDDWEDDWGEWEDDVNAWDDERREEEDDEGTGQRTYLHHFALGSDGKVRYDASGQVDGWIMDQFSLSEYKGVLRVATQVGFHGADDAETRVYTLRTSAKEKSIFNTGNASTAGKNANYLKVLGELDRIGYGEDLYAVRFKGDVGYVVTFRETDPLWTIDLSSPSKPRLRGDLEVPGYSTYLHPVDDGLLLGVGRADWRDGEGVKISIFDVGNLDNPRAIEERELGDSFSTTEVFKTHKAFQWFEDKNLMMLPIHRSMNSGLHVYEVSRDRGFYMRGRIAHREVLDESFGDEPRVLRSLRIGNYMYSYSTAGVLISDLDNLATVATLDFDDLPE